MKENSGQKVLENKKNNLEKKLFNLFLSKIVSQIMYVHIVCNKTSMSRTTYPELYFIITNVCKPPQNFDFPETEQPFTFVLLEEFQWVSYCSWEDGTYYLP